MVFWLGLGSLIVTFFSPFDDLDTPTEPMWKENVCHLYINVGSGHTIEISNLFSL